MMKTMSDGFHTLCANGTGCIEVACMLLGSDIVGKGRCQRDEFWPWWKLCCVGPSTFST
jgi:hypothetical protein